MVLQVSEADFKSDRSRMKTQSYDLIGDIHGRHDKLLALLHALGYSPRGDPSRGESAGWTHPAGRKLVFLGDYIDRGPNVREVLNEVRAMVEAGDALAVMGNHEFSAILYQSAGTGPSKVSADLRGSLAQFAGFEDEWIAHVSWMRRLPLSLDLGGVRAVHACWDERAVAVTAGRSLADESFLHLCLGRDTPERKAVERLLIGPELTVPDDAMVLNAKGMPLPKIRVRWWDLPTTRYPIGDLTLPESYGGRGLIEPAALADFPDYPAFGPPVFFGHYWMPPDRRRAPLAPNLACLDYSGGRGDGPLVAYRWDGEAVLSDAKFHVPCPHGP
jgi:hypothetical protein